MSPRIWVPPLVFLGTALPTVLALHALDVVPDYRIFIAIGVGAIATAMAQSRLARGARGQDEAER
jgi:hypothetical protein